MKREKTKHKGIYKVGNTYYITYYVGSKKYERAVGPRLSMALKEKMERENKIKRGGYGAIERQEKMTFNDLFQLYETEGERKDYILRVKQTYLDYFGGKKLSHITRQDLFSFRDKLKATPKQRGQNEVTNAHVNRVMAGLRRLCNFALNRDLMADTPFPKNSKSGLFYPEKRGLRNFFTEEQMVKIIKGASDWLRPMILTAYYTGMRLGEMLKLCWDYVDLETGIIHLPSSKTLKDSSGLGQRIVMQKELIDLFKTLPKCSEWVFAKADGTPYQHWDIHKPFRKLLRSLNIDIDQYSWKELRHTTATLMHLKGAEIKSIKDQLRHTSIKVTEGFYIGSDVEHQRQQIEKLVLNKAEETPQATA